MKTIQQSQIKYDYGKFYVLSEGENGYAPPVGGVPKTDLSQEVQDSLDNADNSANTLATNSSNEGKVLMTDGQGNATWTTPEFIESPDVEGIDGLILTIQGGTPIWGNPAGGMVVDSLMSLNSENPVLNKVVKQYIDNNAGDKYTLPTGGIPKNDLSESVQTSLSKADTALQQHQDISGKQDALVSGTNIKTINNESILGSGNIAIQGEGSAYVPTLNAAPTSSTTTYTKDGQTVDFKIGQFARVAKQGGGYDFYQLYSLTTSNNVTMATWMPDVHDVIGDINTILDTINGEVI